MKTLSANLILEKNKVATASAWLILLDITLNDSESTQFHLVRNTENITVDSVEYTACNFDMDPVVDNSKGQIPSVDLRVSNVTHFLMPYLLELKGAAGSSVVMTIINSSLTAEDYDSLKLTYLVTATHVTRDFVAFKLGASNPMTQRFPLYRYIALHCRWKFKQAECGYVGKTIAGITLSTPVSIQVTGHGFATGDSILLETCTAITGGLEGTYAITKTDANNFTLQSTTGGDYGGSYTSGGKAGYATCDRMLSSCYRRAKTAKYGGFPGMRSRSIRLV